MTAKAASLRLRPRRIAELLGVEVPEAFVEEVLGRLGFRLDRAQKGAWRVEVPSFRVDVGREADLIEEVARFYGYGRIPSAFSPVRSFDAGADRRRERLGRIRRTLLGQGFDEVVNWSFADPEREAAAGSGLSPVAIQNPISNRASVLRTTLLPGMLENAAWNLNRGLEGVHIFELGNVFGWKGEGHCEELRLGLLSTGLLPGAGWASAPAETDFFVVKGALEALLEALRFEPFGFEERDHPYFEAGRSLSVLVKGQAVGCLGVLRRSFAAASAVDRTVFAAEVDLVGLFGKSPRPFKYSPVPRFPGVVRDLSFLLDRAVPFQDIGKALGRLNLPLLEGYELRDRFAGPSVPEGKVSLTVRFHYRHPQRTLVAGEVDRVEQDIVGHLRSTLNIQLREGKIDIRT